MNIMLCSTRYSKLTETFFAHLCLHGFFARDIVNGHGWVDGHSWVDGWCWVVVTAGLMVTVGMIKA